MNEVTKKSAGFLIDELITVSNKLWHLQDKIEENDLSDKEIANAFKTIQTLNVRRNKLIGAIDKLLDNDSFSSMEKTYS